MSNAPLVLRELSRRCKGSGGKCSRRQGGDHATASGNIAKDAAIYPDGLCRAIIRGTSKELLSRGILKLGEVGMQAETDEHHDLSHVKNSTTG